MTLQAVEAVKLHRLIDDGFALPTRYFADPAIFQLELERIHRRAWHFAAHRGEVAAPGDVMVRNLAGAPIVLVRGQDGAVRGFLNICRHRGHPVVTENGNKHALRCHYHGWTYNLDGSLKHAPRGDTDARFDPCQFGLVPIQTHEWGPMIWANIDMATPSFPEWIAGMPELLRANGLTVEAHERVFDHTWEIDANWKVFQDNTIECYHCPTTHPELAQALEMKPELQKFAVGGRYWIHHQIPFRKGLEEGLTYKKPAEGPLMYYYHWVFPTTYLQYAGKGFDIGSVDVVDVDKIRFRHICFMPPDTPEEVRAKGQHVIERDPTIWQDVEICNRVQVGHRTGLAPTGRMFAAPEFLLSHFQHVIVDMMSETPRA